MDLKNLKGIGDKTLNILNNEGINTILDLVKLEPKSYISYHLCDDIYNDEGLFYITDVRIAKITKMNRTVNMIIFIAIFNHKQVKFITFNKEYLAYQLRKNKNIYVYGKYVNDKSYFLVRNIFITKPSEIKVEYGIKGINDKNLSKLIYQAFNHINKPVERLPEDLINKYKLMSYSNYLIKKHFPKDELELKEIKRRKLYENYFFRTLFYEILSIKNQKNKEIKEFDLNKINELIDKLPYTLTSDQLSVLDTILKELNSHKRINRLVLGDVGTGKTIVAILGAYASMLANYQVAFIAPTVILANQHFKEASKYLDNVYLLTSATKTKERNQILAQLKENKPMLLIGTHSLLSDSVEFNKLGLVIIDEQHRFGVKARSTLQKKYPNCDTLYFTATPIPRSLALTSYGDLDLSMIKTKPLNRGKKTTKLISENELDLMFSEIKERLNNNEQVFVVSSLIESEEDNLWDFDSLSDLFISHGITNIAHISGKMKDKDKVDIITRFNNHEVDVLISTTIIEVGIDIKNASVMVIMDASRYGLSTIHQLRGRVGRGNIDAYIYLVSDDLDNERLTNLVKIDDGFMLAELDLKMRGPGEFLSRKQSGYNNIVNSEYEQKVYQYARYDAKEFVKNNDIELLDNKYQSVLSEINEFEFENN